MLPELRPFDTSIPGLTDEELDRAFGPNPYDEAADAGAHGAALDDSLVELARLRTALAGARARLAEVLKENRRLWARLKEGAK